MIFNSLSIEGITSLKNKVTIDFKQDLYNEDLFAITGATGAGKSSILNAISLALFNSGHKKTSAEEYVSLGAPRARIKLDFSIYSRNYNIEWECRKVSKTGKPIKPVISRVVYQDGQVINKTPEEIIGLSQKQFFKTVIINQGKFSEFLSSPFKDRKKLLEEISDGSELSGLSTHIKRKIKAIQNEIELYNSRLEGGLPFHEETYQKKIVECKDTEDYFLSLKQKINPFTKLNQEIKEILKYSTENLSDKFKIKTLNDDRDILKKEYTKVSKELQLKQKDLDSFKKMFNEIVPELKDLEKIEHHIDKLSHAIEIKEAELQKLKLKNIQLDESLSSYSAKTENLYSELKKSKLQFNKIFQDIDCDFTNSKQSITVLKEIQSGVNLKQKNLLAKKGEIEFQEIDTGTKQKENENIKELNSKIQKSLVSLEDRISPLREKSILIKKEKSLVEKELELHELEMAIHKCLETAKETGECPVCNQSIASVAEDQYLENTDDQKPIILELKEKIKDLSKENLEIEKKLASFLTQAESFKAEFEKNKNLYKASKKKLEEQIKSISLSKIEILENLEKNQEGLKLLNQLLENLSEIDQLDALIKKDEDAKKATNKELNECFQFIKDSSTQRNDLSNSLTTELKKLGFEEVEEGFNFYNNQLEQLTNKAEESKKKHYEAGRKKDVLNNQIEIKSEKIEQQENLIGQLLHDIQQFPFTEYEDPTLLKLGLKLKERDLNPFNKDEIEFLEDIYKKFLTPFCEKLSSDVEQKRDLFITLKTEIEGYEAKLNEFKKYEHVLKDLKSKHKRLEDLLQALGKDEFGRFAAALFERQLINICNSELETLCDSRYELIQQEKNKTNGPEFFVIDHWRDSQLRNISTLSGGETFLVSLAMALGLAELTKGKVELDSFFIDEGFGTLDEESIEEVLETLLTIRSRGKQIGIISHVTSLTDRIPVRIHLEKNQWGESNLTIQQSF